MRERLSLALPTGARAVHLVVTGLVQGVGFRPWVARQAIALGLAGHVQNTGAGVELELHGAPDAVAAFVARLLREAPGRVDAVRALPPGPPPSSSSCAILPSERAGQGAQVGADTAVCAACLDELFDPSSRRFLHPFIHCPACGPRLSIQHEVPFDRQRTSLAGFIECAACVAEGRDPADRRFHDQTNACPRCGPRLWWRRPDGTEVPWDPDGGALAAAAAILAQGGVLALKGVGGFHLVALATATDAIARLRAFKARPTRPLALMAHDTGALAPHVVPTSHERRHLEDPARPIVLVRRRAEATASFADVAPGQAFLGVMLPYAPVHHLLFWQLAGRPPGGAAWSSSSALTPWVVTSANRRGEPLIVDDDEALVALAGVVDGWLLHDRGIVTRADDSVLRVRDDGSTCFLRRSRGFAPLPISSTPAAGAPAVLGLGVDEKAGVCVGRVGVDGRLELSPSPWLGGLRSPASRAAFRELVTRWPRLLGADVGIVGCDAHPDLYSARLARELASDAGLELVEVGHHHAHVAAVIAEQAGEDPADTRAIALALDGHGHGDDGGAWGGELLLVEGDRCERLGHLWPLALVGGDRAAREPWRLAAAALVALGRADDVVDRFPDERHAAAVAVLAGQPGTPRTTSLGRLFDAAAALLGGPARTTFEGEAPLWLECRAVEAPPSASSPTSHLVQWHEADGLRVLDWRPLFEALAQVPGDDVAAVASAALTFHEVVARGLAGGALAAARVHGVDTVVLAGGCLVNRLLDQGLATTLRAAGLRVWQCTRLPCGDQALAVGQAWVANQRWQRRLG